MARHLNFFAIHWTFFNDGVGLEMYKINRECYCQECALIVIEINRNYSIFRRTSFCSGNLSIKFDQKTQFLSNTCFL